MTNLISLKKRKRIVVVKPNNPFTENSTPRFDLKKISTTKKFSLDPFQQYKYQQAINSKEGSKALTELKNKLLKETNYLNNETNKLLIESKKLITNGHEITDQREKVGKLLNEMININLIKDSVPSFKNLGITKHDIWNYFIEKGIIKNETI